ncbi:MAG: integrase arm-type DNA-binding domain-containing protein, partial [Azonexus sp.]|nr:integrase arm-type DNA-binding domain-containing protein [Azonexus sp.]
MSLTDTVIRNAKPAAKAARLFDGGGLYLEIAPSGGRLWRFKYRFDGKEKRLSIGVYPAVSLAQAREEREKARELLAKDPPIDPGTAKREAKIARAVAATNTFEAAAREFHASKAGVWSMIYAKRWLERLAKDLFPYIGKMPLSEIKPPMLLDALRRVEARGAIDHAHTLRQYAVQIFRYGRQTGRCEHDPAADLQGALKPVI